MESNKNDLGALLRDLRGEKSLDEVAGAVGVTVAAISNYENNIRVPRDEIKQKLATFYGKTVGEIFFNQQSHS